MRTMTRAERLAAILERLVSAGRIDVDAAAETFSVSTATIRRDLDHLADQQLLSRTHGGAVPNSTSYDLPMRYKTIGRSEAKTRIAQRAVSMLWAGCTVSINGGTTTVEIARAIPTSEPLHQGITVVTNALNIATELAIRQHIKIVTTGGVARPQSYELTGPLATGVLEQVTLDVAFLGVDGIDAVAGATAHHEGEASINRLMGRQARQVIIVADSSKVGQRAFARICTPAEIDVLVTDAGIAAEDAARLQDAGVDVVTV
jgi:DeoR family transcriptional regulator of aga operon